VRACFVDDDLAEGERGSDVELEAKEAKRGGRAELTSGDRLLLPLPAVRTDTERAFGEAGAANEAAIADGRRGGRVGG
jgi:hypothetical protein